MWVERKKEERTKWTHGLVKLFLSSFVLDEKMVPRAGFFVYVSLVDFLLKSNDLQRFSSRASGTFVKNFFFSLSLKNR